jgi:hypothetical protein
MRGWLLEAHCPQRWGEISHVEEFAQEQFSCVVCRIELWLVHECYEDGDCANITERVPERSQDPGSRAAQRVLEMEARGVSYFEERSCTGKVTFLTRKLARRSARQQRSKVRAKLRPYRCPHCELFHLAKATSNHYRARSVG